MKDVYICIMFILYTTPFQQGEGARAVPLAGHVGFDSMPDQLVNKSVNHGFCFNILCVGESLRKNPHPHHSVIVHFRHKGSQKLMVRDPFQIVQHYDFQGDTYVTDLVIS